MKMTLFSLNHPVFSLDPSYDDFEAQVNNFLKSIEKDHDVNYIKQSSTWGGQYSETIITIFYTEKKEKYGNWR